LRSEAGRKRSKKICATNALASVGRLEVREILGQNGVIVLAAYVAVREVQLWLGVGDETANGKY
jgi:hypothetical protein